MIVDLQNKMVVVVALINIILYIRTYRGKAQSIVFSKTFPV